MPYERDFIAFSYYWMMRGKRSNGQLWITYDSTDDITLIIMFVILHQLMCKLFFSFRYRLATSSGDNWRIVLINEMLSFTIRHWTAITFDKFIRAIHFTFVIQWHQSIYLWMNRPYQWVSARKTQLQCVSNGVVSFFIDIVPLSFILKRVFYQRFAD